MSADLKKTASPDSPHGDWLELVKAQVESLRFGLVQLVVHEGRVTQIETTEKVRLPASRDASSPKS
jgi:hypothetical protein